jgi:2-polyprenyl-6-methoxyphenol hydroxylase-like FAD-dependent oxidoreductase
VSRNAVVVGGGIGGLAAAVGLHRAGWEVTVLEQAEGFAEIGAGIMLWPNALKALRALGMHDRVRELAQPQLSGGLRTSDGRWLNRWEGPVIQQLIGDPAVGIHRARLHRALLEQLPERALRAGVKVGDLTGIDADLIVGADGIGSTVRQRLFPEHPGPAYAGATAWRGICEPQENYEIGITWGRGTEFGIVPLEDGRVYWYASKTAPPGRFHDDERAAVLREFGDWHAPIRSLVSRTENVLHHDIYYLAVPLKSYVDGNVALLGDAAHAMMPNLGQGACQALEDAAVLRIAVQRYAGTAEALAYYDRMRRPRSQSIAKASYRAGRFGSNLTNPVAVALRDGIAKLTPTSISIKGMAGVAKWDPSDGEGTGV